MEEKSDIVVASKFNKKRFTTMDMEDINNVKLIYNLDNKDCDFKINDCIGQSIRVKNVVIKEFDKELEDGKKEFKMVTILIDDKDKTYVTASKVFTIQMKRFIEEFGVNVFNEGLDIKIVSRNINNSKNKALGFELI